MAGTDFVTEDQVAALVTELVTAINNKPSASAVDDIEVVTQAAYDGLSTPRPATTLYLIVG